MQIDDIRTLYRYNQWANQRLLAAVRLLPASEFTRDLRASFGSVKGTLVHVLAGEWNWLHWWQGKPSSKLRGSEDFADAEALASAFPSLEREQWDFISGLTDDLLRAPCKVRASEYALALLMQHLVNHSTYHRGQAATLLRQLGHAPPPTDFRLFLDDAHSRAASSGAA